MRNVVNLLRWLVGITGVGLVGCSTATPEEMTMPPPAVTVSYPLEREVIDYAEFTGRTTAVQTVKIRARVWGHLETINFKEGAEIKKGDLLFVLDQRPYRATLAQAEAEVAQTEARNRKLENDFNRVRTLLQAKAISREEFDKISGELAEAQAAVRTANAAVAIAKLNLDYTNVVSPIDGRISRAWVTVGNLVESGELGGTMMTTVVSLDPMHVYFDVDDQTSERMRSLLDARKASGGKAWPIYLGLASDKGFPHEGVIDFLDNQVDPGTGTLKMRGVLKNANRSLTPGLFARVRMPQGAAHNAVLVTDRAIETDQGQKVMYVVGQDNVVSKKSVRLGRLHDGLREIEAGVGPRERVVVDGILRVRSGLTVAPKEVDMPVYQPNGPPPSGKTN